MKRSIRSGVLIAWCCGMGAGSSLRAADWYVGDVRASPGQESSRAAALRTIQEALEAAVAGDTVRVASGTYHGTVFMKDGVDLVGAGFQTTRIIGGGNAGCVVRGANRCRVEGFTIQGDGQDDVDGIRAEGVRDFQVVRNYVQGHSWSGLAGIHSCMQVIGNTIVSNRVAGVFLDGQSPEPSRLEHNTICGNRNEAGVNVWREAAALLVHNIIVGNTGAGGICCADGGRVLLRRNDVIGNSCLSGPPSDYVGCVRGDGDLAVDPLFADASKGDYRLRRGSPCIDAAQNPPPGDPLALSRDLLGTILPADGNGNGLANRDLGALETEPLRLTIVPQTAGGPVQLVWNSLPGEFYDLLVSASLAGPWVYESRIASTGDRTIWTGPQTPTHVRWFRLAAHGLPDFTPGGFEP